MKVYLVIDEDGERSFVYGVFSTKEKAEIIKSDLDNTFIEDKETVIVRVEELIIDELTETYYDFVNN